jgi:hypothetical protein
MGVIEWVAVLAGLVAVGGLFWWMIAGVSRAQMMRCPDTGAVSLIYVAPAAGAEKTHQVMVAHCDLWPQKKDCTRGCLARYGEAAPGWQVSLNSLRPFEPQ